MLASNAARDSGPRRATSARNTPFQPMAEAPNTTATAATSSHGVAGCRKAVATQLAAIVRARPPRTLRGGAQRSATMPHRIRPATPATCDKDRMTPAAISVHPSDRFR